MELTPEEQAILGGGRGEAAKRALEFQLEVGDCRDATKGGGEA